MTLDLNNVAKDIYEMVAKDHGVKKYKPGDLFKAMMKKHSSEGISKKDCKEALRIMIDSERLVYTYFNGSWVELPGVEGSAMAAQAAKSR